VKVLLDHCMPRPFERLLPSPEVVHTSRLGWGSLINGELLRTAEEAGFHVMVTVDKNMPYQQNIPGRQISLVVIDSPSNDIPSLSPMASLVMLALIDLAPGNVVIVRHP
jgi:hypothetical protein